MEEFTSIAEEIIRALLKITTAYYKNGLVVGYNEGLKETKGACEYLSCIDSSLEKIIEKLINVKPDKEYNKEYSELISDLTVATFLYIENNTNLFNVKEEDNFDIFSGYINPFDDDYEYRINYNHS